MKNLNGKQNLRPEKGICCYLVKFYRTNNTVHRVHVYWISKESFHVSLLCPYVASAATLWVTLGFSRLIIIL